MSATSSGLQFPATGWSTPSTHRSLVIPRFSQTHTTALLSFCGLGPSTCDRNICPDKCKDTLYRLHPKPLIPWRLTKLSSPLNHRPDVISLDSEEYTPYFPDVRDPKMSLKLIYPNTNCSETFFLLGPKSNENSYNPVWDLVRSLYTIIRNFLTPEQQFLLGPLPDSRNPFHHASLVPEEGQTNLYCRWVVALDKKDGRTFISVYQQITQTLRDCSSTGYLNASVGIFPQALTGIPPTVAIRIMDESYQRTIPPYMAAIQDYTAFSSSVYGEITPIALAEMFQLTGLGATSLFVDIGSGVANAVCQASVQTGCESYGIEIEHAPAAAAVALVSNVKTRCLMWSTRVGKITVEYGDARTSTELREVRIPKADVVLVNNRIFDAKLNLRLGELLQNLKDGALVISSVPFGTSMHASTRVPRTELPWCITHHVYSDDGNSWNGKAEGYYIGRVNKVL